jgi:hypothetical protein
MTDPATKAVITDAVFILSSLLGTGRLRGRIRPSVAKAAWRVQTCDTRPLVMLTGSVMLCFHD